LLILPIIEKGDLLVVIGYRILEPDGVKTPQLSAKNAEF
jgi:hypothetical protein